MRVYSGSDIGLTRDSNQDDCKTGVFSDNAIWVVVCDGMGGANGGCTASTVATETISQKLIELYTPFASDDWIREIMEVAIQEANLKVFDISMEDSSLHGMGTTVVCAIARDHRLQIVHAGDSRAYLVRDGEISRITTDHSVVQELVSAGEITDEQARVHPSRNIITRALGVEPYLETDYNTAEFPEGSVLMICTDGLCGYFSDEELLGLMQSVSGDELISKLIDAAKDQGGRDNITVALIEG